MRDTSALKADRYIMPDGSAPQPGLDEKTTRIRQMSADMATLISFVCHHDPMHIMGGVRQPDAERALARIVGATPEIIRKIARVA